MITDDTNFDPTFAKAITSSQKLTIGFYNVENLFDTKNDAHTLDDEFTPEGDKEWTSYRYKKKVKKIAKVISQIGATNSESSPSLVGLAEVENASVLEDLIAAKHLHHHNYDYVHWDSPDERGIDVALLYKKKDFTVTEAAPITLFLETRPGVRDRTRDILYVKGRLQGTDLHILINHWPSKRLGAEETEHKRISAAKRNREIIDKITKIDPDARIIIMGDFNDSPSDVSVRDHLVQRDFYNPMVFLGTRYEGSINHSWRWYMYDQIIFSNNFMRLHENTLIYETSGILNSRFLTEYKGKFKGFPFRSYAGTKYLGGYSDHFPVFSILTSK